MVTSLLDTSDTKHYSKANSMSATLIDGKATAARLGESLTQEVAGFRKKTGIVPHLAAILVGDDPASAVYVRNKQRACKRVGIKSTLHQLSAQTTTSQLLELIDEQNRDPLLHGILVQLPLPQSIATQQVLDAILPTKDVDAFHPENVGRIVQGRSRFLPCTPHGIQVLLQEYNIETSGAHAVILGRSEIVGKPMSLLLMQKGDLGNATVTVCHSRTKHLSKIVSSADIVIAAIGKAEFVTSKMIQPGAVVIDVGINRVDGKLKGDVEFDTVRNVASAITPVPGGVGPMTIMMLMKNTLQAAQLSRT